MVTEEEISEIRSINDFKKLFYPQQYERDYLKSLSPKELAIYLAKKSLESVTKNNYL